MLGIIGAMDEEVAMIKAQLTDVQVETRAAMDFYKGKLEGKEVVAVSYTHLISVSGGHRLHGGWRIHGKTRGCICAFCYPWWRVLQAVYCHVPALWSQPSGK